MQPQIKKEPKLTIEEYIKLEQEAQQKYEFHNGYVYAMAGGTDSHNTITMNISGEIYAALKVKDCKIKNSDTKLYLENNNKFVYPDAMIICGKQEESEKLKDAFTNPIVIIEVLSESTGSYDRGDKFGFYRQIPSLRHYILIEQDKIKIDIFSRQSSTSLWDIRSLENIENNLELAISDTFVLSISLKDIFNDVIFEEL